MQEEAYGTRDRSYSAWHRRRSTSRYIGIESAQTLAMIDLDASLYVEYDDGKKDPLALIETAIDVGQPYKTATVTKKLAQRAKLPAFVLLYKLSKTPNPADHLWPDIVEFRAKVLHWPFVDHKITKTGWVILQPAEWCKFLRSLRSRQAAVIDKEFRGGGNAC